VGLVWDFLRGLAAAMPGRLALAAVLTLAVAFTEGVGLLLLLPLLGLVGLELGGGAFGELANVMEATLTRLGVAPTLAMVLVVYAAVVVVGAALSRIAGLSGARLAHGYAAQLRGALQAALTGASWLFHTRGRGSHFTQVLTTETSRVVMATDGLLTLLVRTVVMLVYLTVAVAAAPLVTSSAAAVGGVLFLLFRRQVRRGHRIGRDIVDANAAMYSAIGEDLGGIKLIKGHGVESRSVRAFSELTDRVARLYVAVARVQLDVEFWFRSASVVSLSVLVYLAVAVAGLTAAGVLVLIYVFARLAPIAQGLQGTYQAFVANVPSYAAVTALLEASRAASERTAETAAPLSLVEGIAVEHVHFGYRSDMPVLHDVTLHVAAGRTTAIVGSSGSGKSTLADMLIGLLVPDTGRIVIDGRPLQADWLQAWRSNIGYVPQDAFVFHASVRSNLLVTRPEASEDELWEALEAASAREFVERLPEGLDTVLGDRGVRISGGERQRVALARALLRRPALLVLDEATSNLDVDNERRVQRAVDALRGRLTIVIIAHRLATVRRADRVLVLEAGRVTEEGTFETLLARPGGRFQAMCREQGLVPERSVPAVGPHAQ
jgi:ATP-binding cassette, subfamily C, bacterial